VPREFDLSHVQAEHFAAALGKDPQRIFEFVRDQIAFEPYVGLLRGPRGTLLAMAGNAVDQAALLGSLLQHSGFRVRFVRGTLPDQLVEQRLDTLWDSPPLTSSIAPGGGSFAPLAERIAADIRRDTSLILGSLENANLAAPLEPFVTLDALRKETQDHYWVEWLRDGVWTAMDPSGIGAAPGQTFTTSDAVWDTLPDAVVHRVEIRVRVEEWTGGGTTTRHVLRYAANASDLSGVDLILAHQSIAGDSRGPSQVRPTLFAGSEEIPGSPFHLRPPASAAGGIADAFGGGTDETPVAIAEAIELEFVAPDGRRETIVREIFDSIGPHRRARGEANPMPLASTTGELTAGIYDLFFTTGALDAWHLTDLAPERADDGSVDVGAGLRQLNTVFCVVSDLLTRRMGGGGPILRTYLDAPRVQISEWAPADGRLRIGLDLRKDTARVVTSEHTPASSFRAHVLRGVANGVLERVVVEHLTRTQEVADPALRSVVSTSSLFERARAGGIPFGLVTQRSALGSDLPPDAAARVAAALGRGQLIVAPKRAVPMDGAPRFAWWQVDARSGATIGVTDEGLHQTVEAVIIRYKDSYHVAFRVNGRFISTQGRRISFASRAQAENFCTLLGNRLRQMGMDYAWFAL
jgi:hypothetical protein